MFPNMTHGMGTDPSPEGPGSDLSDGPAPLSRSWDTSDPFLSATTRVLMQRVLKCYVRQMIVFVGIPCNAVCCVVFFKQGLSDRVHLLLFWLAVADLTNLTAQLLLMPDCYLANPIHITNWTIIVNTKLAYINWSLSYASGMLNATVSLDRCLSVALPFKAKILLSYRAMIAAIGLAYLVPVIGHLPCLLANTVRWRVDPSTHQSIAYIQDTEWFPLDGKEAVSYCIAFSLIAIPSLLVITMVCCTITIICLRRASYHRELMAGKTRVEGNTRDSRITKMLLFLCFICIVLFLFPCASCSFVTNSVPEFHVFRKYHNTYIITMQFLWIASCLNSTANFFVYLVLSSRFKKTLKELCCCYGHTASKRDLNL